MSIAGPRLAAACERLRRSAAVADWMRSVGLKLSTLEAALVGLDGEKDGRLSLIFPLRAEDGTSTVSRIIVDAAGTVFPGIPGSPSAMWSAPAYVGAEVLVVRDPVEMWLLQQALGPMGLEPTLLVAATHRTGLPPRWDNPDYWLRFDQVTLLVDGLDRPDHLRAALATMSAVEVAAALPPGGIPDWRTHLAAIGTEAAQADLRALIEDAPVLTDLVADLAGAAIGRSDLAAVNIHDLDQRDRLRRVIAVEERVGGPRGDAGSRRSRVVIRSDRTLLGLGPVAAPRGTRPVDRLFALSDGDRIALEPGPGASSAWSLASAEEWIARRTPAYDDSEMLGEVSAALVGFGLSVGHARQAAAFVLLTYIYQWAPQLPLLVAVCPDPSGRAGFARLMMRLCHNGRIVGRARGRQLAHIADETGGAMAIVDPGPLEGPSGPTEIGRFLLASASPGLSTEHEIGSGVARTLRTFGPRIVCCGRRPALSWSDTLTVTVDRISPQSAVDYAALVDRLYVWSMDASGRLGIDLRQRYGLGCLEAVASGLGCIRAEADDENTVSALDDLALSAVSPDGVLEDALEQARLRTGNIVSIVQLTLEVALTGAEGDAYSPERIGRWLIGSGALQPGKPVNRRRLFGHITRLYTLAGAAPASHREDDGLGFCTGSECGTCRYSNPCARIFPALNAARQRSR